jgi:hypothetical protein
MSWSIPASKLLLRAAQEGDVRQCQALIVDGNADVNYQNEVGDTALHVCCELGGRLSIIELLLGYDADPNISRRPTCGGETPLHIAVRKLNAVVVQKLLSGGADANIAAGGGTGSKADVNHSEILNVARGASDVERHMNYKSQLFPGSMIVSSPFQETVDQRKWMSLRTAGGRLPLHIAAEMGDLEMCKLLVLSGNSNREIADFLGRFPKDVARFHGHHDVATFLTSTDGDRPPADVTLSSTQLAWHSSIKK